MSERETRLYGVIFLLAIALTGVGAYSIASAQNNPGSNQPTQTNKLSTIVVTGVGTASMEPNLAKVELGVLTQASKASDALQRNAEKMNAVIDALEAIGMSRGDMETSYFSLYPVYSDYGEPSTIVGYRVSNRIAVSTTDLSKVGEVIDTGVEAGANQVSNVQLTFTEGSTKELGEQARQKAVEDANAKATTIANSLKIEIIGVAHVSEATISYSPYWMDYRELASGTPIIPGEATVTVSIEVTYIFQ